MRYADLEALRVPLPDDQPIDPAFARAVGVEIPALRQLYREVFDDLDDEVFGVRWWAGQLGTTRRILVSHHLVECIRSVEINLVEASLHLLEATDHWERESDFLADVIQRRPDGSLQYEARPRATPAEDLSRRLATLHVVGFVRAIGSALDCLGASIIGVLALPRDLRFADFGKAQKALAKAAYPLQQDFARRHEIAISEVGPAGWLQWTLDLRNMYVHRGRRSHTSQLLPRPEGIYGPDGQLVPRLMALEQLPSDPYRSQVEAFVAIDEKAPVLTEHAEVTLRGIRRSTVDLVTWAARDLVEIWRTRRASPEDLAQSKEQWPEGCSRETSGFIGFSPGSAQYDPTEIHTDRDTWRQFRTAALEDAVRPRWASFD